MYILGIETSCDETSASILEAKLKNENKNLISPEPCFQAKLKNEKVKILSNIVSSQIDLHKKYGGVFPELASRAHLENIIPVVNEALVQGVGNRIQGLDKNSNYTLNAVPSTLIDKIDLLVVTTGPGLVGSLLVGVNFAKTLSYTLQKPIIPVNHLEGHIFSSFAEETPNSKFLILNSAKLFPIISLVVSGGHTSLILMKKMGHFQTIGETQDDAAGEAFDKVAALLGLPYPGGPAIEAAASRLQTIDYRLQTKLPRPMIDSNDFNFSFSGLKTAVLYLMKQMPDGRKTNVRRTVAKEFQQAVIDVLISKTISAAKKYKTKTIILCGGVSANSLLRKELELRIMNLELGIKFLVPPKILSTDNAVMIAIAGYYKSLKTKPQKWYDINADSNERLENWVK